jgi:hypothetical protein
MFGDRFAEGLDGGREMNVDYAAARVRAEFEEMPGMTLTLPQAERLFGLDQDLLRAIVERLVRASYLRQTDSGAFTRLKA